jgi:opacity protein-like surface antigen
MKRIALLSLLALAFATSAASAEHKKLVVVVVKGSGITNISKSDLKRCFLGDPVSGGGKTLVPFNAEARTAERSGFDQAVLGMSPDETGRFWVDRKVRGQSGAPRSLPTVLHVAKVVAKFPGAIGYVPADALTPDLQPVSIDGVAYTATSYSLVTE